MTRYYSMLIIKILCLLQLSLQGQQAENWPRKEQQCYTNFKGLCQYLEKTNIDHINDSLLSIKYISIDLFNGKNTVEKNDPKAQLFDSLIKAFKKTVDSIGSGQIDAIPIKFYKTSNNITIQLKKQMVKQLSNIFIYYKKNSPQEPLGYLLFDEENFKLRSWVIIDQGATLYFFTFDLI